MAEKSDITISFESLFELLRREKNREDIQELYPAFYQDLAHYLKNKSR